MGSGRGQARRVQVRAVDTEDDALRLTGMVDSWSDDLVLSEPGDHGVVEYSLSEEAARRGLLERTVVVKIDDAVKVLSESKVKVRFRGVLSIDKDVRLLFDGQPWPHVLAMKPGDRVRLELSLAKLIVSEPSKVMF